MFEEENFIYNTQGSGCEPAAKLSVYIRHLSGGQLEFAFFFHSATGKPSEVQLSPSKKSSPKLISLSSDCGYDQDDFFPFWLLFQSSPAHLWE